MSKRPLKVRRLMIAGVVAAVAAASLVLVPAAMESTQGNGLYAFVTLTNPGRRVQTPATADPQTASGNTSTSSTPISP
jgi:hypothetical protein